MKKVDVILIGSGIMSTTLGMFLKLLNPKLKIALFEKEEELTTESTLSWNNAGTGHAAYCELNYTPEDKNKKISIEKAKEINESFVISLQLWAYLVENKIISNSFISKTPHINFVWGKENINFLKARYEKLKLNAQFSSMEFSDDFSIISKWIPLIMQGRNSDDNFAATRVEEGTDVDFGKLTKSMLDYLIKNDVDVYKNSEVKNLSKINDNQWLVAVKNKKTKTTIKFLSDFVFIGAGGASLSLLQKSKITQSKLYAGFPVSGQFLVCHNQEVIKKHQAKVYGRAEVNAPPMSVPHLDTRIIDGNNFLLFGPFAGGTTQFLKKGSVFDLFKSINLHNIFPMIQVGFNNISLIRYLLKEMTQSHNKRMNALRQYYPEAKNEDWKLIEAGKRVQIIKKTDKVGRLQLGTEIVMSDDYSLSALLGASPGASIVVKTILEILEKSFPNEIKNIDKVKKIIPSYGEKLTENDGLLNEIRANIKKTLGL